ncbi:MAG: hypothetical protein AB7O62_06100 [Pirellulales bacterium]
MPIPVICPGCKASFRVSDQFAGKQGPCPKCKAIIKIPAASAAEVVIHAPEEYASGGKDSTGRATAKPIVRPKSKIQLPVVVSIAVGAIVALVVARLARGAIAGNLMLQAVGLLLVTPPLTVLGYMIFRNDEVMEVYSGLKLWLRAGICSLVYIGLWGGFKLIPEASISEYWMLVVIVAPILVVGGLTALGCFDLDFGNGFFHYCLYLAATIALRFAAGLPVPWNIEF